MLKGVREGIKKRREEEEEEKKNVCQSDVGIFKSVSCVELEHINRVLETSLSEEETAGALELPRFHLLVVDDIKRKGEGNEFVCGFLLRIHFLFRTGRPDDLRLRVCVFLRVETSNTFRLCLNVSDSC